MMLSLQTRIVLAVSGIALLAGTAVFWVALVGREGGDGFLASGLEALFLSVTARTAGFSTVPVEGLGEASLVLLILLMFMGASPGSTGGGVKTTTIGVLLASSWSRLRGWESISLFKRTVPPPIARRAGSILLVAGHVVFVFLFLLLAVEAGNLALKQISRPFLSVLFETVSAFGTVGLSMGATSAFSEPGLVLLSVLMFVGRLGPLTVAIAVSRVPAPRVRHPEEDLMVG